MIHDPDADKSIAERFKSLHTLLISTNSIENFLQDLALLATEVVSPPVSCGITTSYNHHPLTVASSDAPARAVDEAQYEVGEGPCLEAFDEGKVVDVPDLPHESRWSSYVPRARDVGLCSSLSLPLIVREDTLGAMNLYSFEHVRAFGADERRGAMVFADQASTALMLALREAETNATNRQLEEALSSRSVIDQALGILMSQQRCDAEEAFSLLRAHSQNNNRKLRDVAADLVTRTTGTDLGGPKPFRR